MVTVENLQKKIKLNPAQITRITKTILRHEGIAAAGLSLVFVTSQKIRALNKKYLNRNTSTDVLAFDLTETKRGKGIKKIDGEVVISTDAAMHNARVYKTPVKRELILYIIHGILHLSGYDDHKTADIEKMRRREKKLLAYLESKGEV